MDETSFINAWRPPPPPPPPPFIHVLSASHFMNGRPQHSFMVVQVGTSWPTFKLIGWWEWAGVRGRGEGGRCGGGVSWWACFGANPPPLNPLGQAAVGWVYKAFYAPIFSHCQPLCLFSKNNSPFPLICHWHSQTGDKGIVCKFPLGS